MAINVLYREKWLCCRDKFEDIDFKKLHKKKWVIFHEWETGLKVAMIPALIATIEEADEEKVKRAFDKAMEEKEGRKILQPIMKIPGSIRGH